MQYFGTEHLMMSSARYVVKGDREIAAIHFEQFWAFAQVKLAGSWDVKSETLPNFLQRGLQGLTVQDVNTLQETGAIIFRAVARAGSLVYIPSGYVVAERVVGSMEVIGLRLQCLDSAPMAVAGIKSLQTVAAQNANSISQVQRDIINTLMSQASPRFCRMLHGAWVVSCIQLGNCGA